MAAQAGDGFMPESQQDVGSLRFPLIALVRDPWGSVRPRIHDTFFGHVGAQLMTHAGPFPETFMPAHFFPTGEDQLL